MSCARDMLLTTLGAVLLGFLLGGPLYELSAAIGKRVAGKTPVPQLPAGQMGNLGQHWPRPPQWRCRLGAMVEQAVIPVPYCALAIVVYWRLRRRTYWLEGESLCRRCGYVLRGLPKPRCPECGERI